MAQAGRRLGRGRRDHRLDLDRQDRHRRRVAGGGPGGGDPRRGRRDGRGRRRAGADRHRRQAGRGARLGATARPRRHERGRGRAGGRRRRRRAAGRHRRVARGTAQRGRRGAARGARRYSPVVMRIAAEHDIDLEQVEGTGRGGRVRKQDVLAFLETGGRRRRRSRRCTSSRPTGPTSRRRRASRSRGSAAPAAAGAAPARPARAGRQRPLSRMRQSIGAHMIAVAADRGDLHDDRRGRHDARRGARREARASPCCRSSRARTIEALREFPALNATLEGETLTTYDGVHLGIAVSLGEGGLIVPVIRDAQELSVEGLAEPDQGPRPARARRTRSRPTRSAAARSRSPTPAATARSWPRR